ncbi:MAG: hypothetical protein ACJATK_002312, partial [Paracoccaceae bacterium]
SRTLPDLYTSPSREIYWGFFIASCFVLEVTFVLVVTRLNVLSRITQNLLAGILNIQMGLTLLCLSTIGMFILATYIRSRKIRSNYVFESLIGANVY